MCDFQDQGDGVDRVRANGATLPHLVSDGFTDGEDREVVAVIGAGPAGLMAADVLRSAGYSVRVFDRMSSVGRKFLMAGRGGLNLTHSEAESVFVTRYTQGGACLAPLLARFGAAQVRSWAADLGIETFVGTSGRVFPVEMKAAPLLRAWLRRLQDPQFGPPVTFHLRHRWLGWATGGALVFEAPGGEVLLRPAATVLALGGGSWSRLGSDGRWVSGLRAEGVEVAPLLPSNCGFDVQTGWSDVFRQKFSGSPLKTIGMAWRPVSAAPDAEGQVLSADAPLLPMRRGECVVTATGLEGGLVYAASSDLRSHISQVGQAVVLLDLLPDWTSERVLQAVAAPRGSRSLSSHLKSKLGLDGAKLGLLHELVSRDGMRQPQVLAAAIKALPVTLVATRPIDEAISTAGGVCFEAMTPDLMLTARAGVFCAGEMLDWDAPTGGYLLTACLATGHWAGKAAAAYLAAAGMPSAHMEAGNREAVTGGL
jgi:hypothetical protein